MSSVHTDPWLSRALEERPHDSARAAGLLYVETDCPGYTRLKCGKGFTYRCPDGRTVKDRALRRRFDALAIPPAWRDVWICPAPEGHLQATGRDDAGRKQYIYHPKWRKVRDARKYDRVIAFGRLLPEIRAQVAFDLRGTTLHRRRVLAAVVRLLETTLVRVGNDEYARHNDSYGLTTIRKKHVVARGDGAVTLAFTGKSGCEWKVDISDRPAVEVIEQCLETPGYEIFKYFDESGVKRDVVSDDVNQYLRELAGANVSAKDFRTWAGTVLAAVALEEMCRAQPDLKPEKRVLRVIERVAGSLGNTPAICRSCYIHPDVLALQPEDLDIVAQATDTRARHKLEAHALRPEEEAVLRLLERRLRLRIERGPAPTVDVDVEEPLRLAS